MFIHVILAPIAIYTVICAEWKSFPAVVPSASLLPFERRAKVDAELYSDKKRASTVAADALSVYRSKPGLHTAIGDQYSNFRPN
jgi:hypothetical protein